MTQIHISNNKNSFKMNLMQFQHSLDFKILLILQLGSFLIDDNLANVLFSCMLTKLFEK